MKSRLMLIAASFVGLAAFNAVALAQTDGTAPRGAGDRAGIRERMLKEFDKDGDGKLSDEERAAARKAMEERRGATTRPAREGADGAIREKLLKEFDKDGDGKLSDEERAAARKAMEERRANRKRPAQQ